MKNTLIPLMTMTLFTLNNFAGSGSSLPAEKIINVAYGAATEQRMDVYLPSDRSPGKTRSIILIHGGAWSSGSRKTFNAYVDSFHRRMPGYAIFNVDYRLHTANTIFPAQEEDIHAAVDFIAPNASRYAIRPDGFVLLGVSAGGHLALLHSYKHASPAIAAVIDFFGPTDLKGMYEKPWHPMIPFLLESLIGGTPSTKPRAYEAGSPSTFVNSKSPATLIFHGANDQTVHISQSRLLKQKLDAAGVKNELVVYDHAGHGWHGDTLADSFDRIEKFLKRYQL